MEQEIKNRIVLNICKEIIFEKKIFSEKETDELSEVLKDYNLGKRNIIFNKCTFEGNLRIDNIKCNKLSFYNCIFENGGGIKNRDGDKKLKINKLVFKPYKIEGDFVIDLGAYVNDKGIINQDKGIIKKIEFENHQVGNGKVFFIGLNEYLENGRFKNRILDNVVFENCNLTKCVFLNSKIDKTEFINVNFTKCENLPIMLISSNRKEGIIDAFIIIIELIFLSFILLFFKSTDLNVLSIFDYIMIILLNITFIFTFIFLFAPLDTIYTFFLSKINNFLDKNNNTYLNKHIATYDEVLILNELNSTKSKDYQAIVESLKSLKNLYDQLAINFLKTDKQLWGEFMYSSKYYDAIVRHNKWDFINVFPNRLNHLINGYGRRWFRTLWWIFITIFFFGYLFTYFAKPNIDYISTKDTPYFLVSKVRFDSKKGIIYYNESSFVSSLNINGEWNKKNSFFYNFYGYDNRFNFNNLDTQYILKLNNDPLIGLCKSLSNLLYPFNFENKKWFENVTPKAFILSIIESLVLWLLILALIRALWNVVVY